MPNVKLQRMGSSSTFDYALGLKDGTMVSVPWVQAMVLKGRVFHAYFGSATTPATLDASYAATDPDISLDVPDGTAIIPLMVRVVAEAYGTTLLFETFTLCSKTLAAASAGTLFTPINMATRQGNGSACKVYTGPTVTDGNTTDAFELYRNVQAKAVTIATADDDSTWQHNIHEWNIAQKGYAPVLHGEASMQTWAIAQAITGYIQYEWLELSEDDLKY